jgi:ComF family protein
VSPSLVSRIWPKSVYRSNREETRVVGENQPGSLVAFGGKLAASLFSVLFPSDCRICGVPLSNVSRLPVCPECLNAIHPIEGTVCITCGERIFSPYAVDGATGPRCGLCRRVEPIFSRAVAYGSYQSGLRELIHLLKFGGVRPAASVLGYMLGEAISRLEPEFPAGDMALIPVPLHRSKLRQRGFNQAELTARAALNARERGDRLRLCTGVLIRKRETASQIGLTSHQRRENLRGAFAVAQPKVVLGREVLLVDDVYTTGATVSECARVLRRAGATKVWVATIARTLKISAQEMAISPGGADEAIGALSLTPAAGG